MAQRFVVQAVALLSAKLSEKAESSEMIVIPRISACRKQSKHLKETRDKPRKGKKTASQRVSKATAFFFYCIAELAVKPCRSSRSNTRGGFEKIP